MKTVSKAVVAAALLCAGTAFADSPGPKVLPEDQGVMFSNGLSDAISEGYAMRQDNCDVFLCDKWDRLDYPDRVLSAGKSAVMVTILTSAPEGKPRVCSWALKIVTQPADGSTGITAVFPALDLCTPKVRSEILFTQDDDGKMMATLSYKDEEGEKQSMSVEGTIE